MSPSVSGFTCVKASARPSGDQPPALCCTAFDIEPPVCGIEPPACGIVPPVCGIDPGIELVLVLPIDGAPCMSLGRVKPMRGSSMAAIRLPGPLRSEGIDHIVNGSGMPARNVICFPSGVQSGEWLEPSNVTFVNALRVMS